MGKLVANSAARTIPWFDDRKAAQVVAFFVNQSGGSINVLKATKLLYLSDRTHLERFGFPITNDHYVSMPYGPVNSLSYSAVNGQIKAEGWNEFIADKANHELALKKPVDNANLDELSDAELETLGSVWEKFGTLDQWQIAEWTHDNCPEWEDPDGSSFPIPHERILKFLGHANASELAGEILAQMQLDKVFAKLRV